MRVKKGIYWGAFMTPIILGICFLVGGFHEHARRHFGYDQERMGLHGGFEGRHMMYGYHHGGEFSWPGVLLFLIIGIAILVFLVKWLRKKTMAASMEQFIDTSMSSHRPFINQNASILDQWEKNVTTKKENE